MNELPTYRAYGETVSLMDALEHARLTGQFGFMRSAARAVFLQRQATQLGIEPGPSELQAAADAFRRREGLLRVSSFREWQARHGLSEGDFEALARLEAIEMQVRETVTEKRIVPYFEAHHAELEEAELSRILVQEQGLAGEIYLMILDGEESFARLASRFSKDEASAKHGGYVGLIPFSELDLSLHDALRKARPGELLTPNRTSEGWEVLRCERYCPPELDGPMRERIQRRVFEGWLEEHEGTAALLYPRDAAREKA